MTKGQKRREEILDVAKEITINEGYNSLTFRKIAERLSITHGNLQYYYPTKNDLFRAIMDRELTKFTESLKLSVTAASSKRGSLDAIIQSAYDLMKKPDRILWQTLCVQANHNTELADILKRENEQYCKSLENELKMIAPHLSDLRLNHISKIVNALLDGLGVQLTYEDHDGFEMNALISEIRILLFLLLEENDDITH